MLPLVLFIFALTEYTYNILYVIFIDLLISSLLPLGRGFEQNNMYLAKCPLSTIEIKFFKNASPFNSFKCYLSEEWAQESVFVRQK